MLDAEEESAIRVAREEELRAEGRAPDEAAQVAYTVRLSQTSITLELASAIPHLFTKRVRAKCLDELCAAVAESTGVPRAHVYVQGVVTHPAVVVTVLLVEPPGGVAAAALCAAVESHTKRHARRTLDGLAQALVRHVTLGGGAGITPKRAEKTVEFARVRRVRLFDGHSVGMYRMGEDVQEAELDRPRERKKKKGGFMSVFGGITGGADMEDTLAEDEEREEQKRLARWQRRKERKMTTMTRFALREGRKNAITKAFVDRNQRGALLRDEVEGLTHSAPAAVRRIVALTAFGGKPKKPPGAGGVSTPDPVRNKAAWGGALQTLRDKGVLAFEDGLSFNSDGTNHGDLYLEVVPKIFVAYSHEVEVDLEDSDDEDNIATTVPGDDSAGMRIMNMLEFRALVGGLEPKSSTSNP